MSFIFLDKVGNSFSALANTTSSGIFHTKIAPLVKI